MQDTNETLLQWRDPETGRTLDISVAHHHKNVVGASFTGLAQDHSEAVQRLIVALEAQNYELTDIEEAS